MATDAKTLQETGDALLEAGTDKALTFQEQYLTDNDRYAQCIQTPKDIPVDGVKKETDPEAKPFYQEEAWVDLGFNLPVTCEVSVRIDTFDGPNGKDWASVASFWFGNDLYTKVISFSELEVFSHDWEVVTVDDPTLLLMRKSIGVDPIDVDPIGVLEPDFNP